MTDNVPDRPTQPPLTEEEKQYYRMPERSRSVDWDALLREDSDEQESGIERSGTG